MNRVVITGAEVISPIGNSMTEFFTGIKTGEKGIGIIKGIDTEHFPTKLGAEVKKNGVPVKFNSSIDRKAVFIQDAMEQLFNKYPWIKEIAPEKKYLNLGAGLDYINLQDYTTNSDKERDASIKQTSNTSEIVKDLAVKYEIEGGNSVFVTACVASSQAVGQSYRLLKNNSDSRLVITGGFESMLNHVHYMGFYKLGALSNWIGKPSDSCRPFDKDRSGLVMGEGAATLILQNKNDADSSNILAEIVGYSSTMDSYMVTDPLPNGDMLAKAALQALAEAGISEDEIDTVNLHGTGTRKNALAESNALKEIFGDRYKEIPVFSLKGQVGHTIAACGALEIISAIYSLQNQVVPPTINYETQDHEAPLNVVKGEALKMKIKYILKLNSAFGGQNTAIILKKYDE